MHIAVQKNNMDIVEMLLSNNADPNKGDSLGRTSLHTAILWNNRDMVYLLNLNGADLTAQDKAGQTGLHLAARNGAAMCNLLISLKMPLNIRDNNGRSPLFLAAAEGNKDIVSLLVQNGVYLDSRDNEGRTALLYALQSDSNASPITGALSLVKAGADIFAADLLWPYTIRFHYVQRRICLSAGYPGNS